MAQINSLQCALPAGASPAIVVQVTVGVIMRILEHILQCLAAARVTRSLYLTSADLESQSTVPKAATTTFRIMWLIWLP